MHALFVNGDAVELFDADPDLHPGLDVRDVSGVDGFALGWRVDADGAFAPPLPEPPPGPPLVVSSAQAKIALKRAGYLPAVKAAIDALDDEEASIWFTDARVWERANAYVAQIAEALGLSDADTDTLFVAAAQIAA